MKGIDAILADSSDPRTIEAARELVRDATITRNCDEAMALPPVQPIRYTYDTSKYEGRASLSVGEGKKARPRH